MPDAFEVLGGAHREMKQMLYLIGGTAELRERGRGAGQRCFRHEITQEQYSRSAIQEEAADGDPLAAGGAEQEPKPGKCSPSRTERPPVTRCSFG